MDLSSCFASVRVAVDRRNPECGVHLSSFAAAWETFVTHIRDAFLLESRAVSAPALRCLERALKAVATPLDDAKSLRQSLSEIWEKTWAKCEEMGSVIVPRASAAVQP